MYLIDINVSAEIDEYPSLRSQDIRKKTKCHGRAHGRMDNVKTVYPTTNKVCGGGVWLCCSLLYIPWLRGGRTYCFWCRSGHSRRPRPSAFYSSLPNQGGGFLSNWQWHIIGMGERHVWWRWLNFLGHTSTSNVYFDQNCLHPISWTKWWILTKLKAWLDFGDLVNHNSLPLSLESKWWFLAKLNALYHCDI